MIAWRSIGVFLDLCSEFAVKNTLQFLVGSFIKKNVLAQLCGPDPKTKSETTNPNFQEMFDQSFFCVCVIRENSEIVLLRNWLLVPVFLC